MFEVIYPVCVCMCVGKGGGGGRGVKIALFNRPFPSSLLPLFQNECKRETFHMKMSLIYI